MHSHLTNLCIVIYCWDISNSLIYYSISHMYDWCHNYLFNSLDHNVIVITQRCCTENLARADVWTTWMVLEVRIITGWISTSNLTGITCLTRVVQTRLYWGSVHLVSKGRCDTAGPSYRFIADKRMPLETCLKAVVKVLHIYTNWHTRWNIMRSSGNSGKPALKTQIGVINKAPSASGAGLDE